MPVVLRRGQHRDLGALTALLGQLFVLEEKTEFDDSRQKQGLTLMLDCERSCILVAEEAGQVVGMGTGQLFISPTAGGLSLMIENLIVEAAHQGKGIGRSLVRALTNWGQSQGVSRMQLLADKNNYEALSFYHRLGWQSTAQICLRQATHHPSVCY